MNLVVLHSLILVTQLSLLTYGKPSIAEASADSVSDHALLKEDDKSDLMQNYGAENENFMKQVLHKMTPDPASSCNE
jgi:hypothetical protein